VHIPPYLVWTSIGLMLFLIITLILIATFSKEDKVTGQIIRFFEKYHKEKLSAKVNTELLNELTSRIKTLEKENAELRSNR